jgi:deoxyribodipyrimidine photo-lyase
MPDPFEGRVSRLNDTPRASGDYVLYWMQQSQRTRFNHALEYAIRTANEQNLPILVCFGLMPDYPDATERHYRFMLEGLRDVASSLSARGAGFVLRSGHPADVALDLGTAAAEVVCDRGYLRHQREWRFRVARELPCSLVEVESDLIVPVESASIKQEYAARTIRPKLHELLGDYLLPLDETEIRVRWKGRAGKPTDLDASSPGDALGALSVPSDPGPVIAFHPGGQEAGRDRLNGFIRERLRDFETLRNEPGLDVASGLSPYLHFGQLSSLQIAFAARAEGFVDGLRSGSGRMKNQPGSVGVRTDEEPEASSRDAFLEELIVRRGLAHNYAWYNRNYDSYSGLPDWARRTLEEHRSDARETTYSEQELITCNTHDEHWNNAMTEMLVTGSMHNYMRMYWGKKILEWTEDPEQAFSTTLRLNNRYFLDGRDPNSFANVGWVFGLHDRPWTEREIFGKIRYMNANGLKRKFDMAAYALKVQRLADRADK